MVTSASQDMNHFDAILPDTIKNQKILIHTAANLITLVTGNQWKCQRRFGQIMASINEFIDKTGCTHRIMGMNKVADFYQILNGGIRDNNIHAGVRTVFC